MSVHSILEYLTSDGLTLSVSSEGNLDILGDQDKIDNWIETIRENKAAILAELTGNALCNVTETFPVTHGASAMRTHSDGKYSVTCTDASTDPILVEVIIAGQASFTLEIPLQFYDGLALLEILEQHNAQAAETHSVMSGLSNETEGIESRRAA